MNKDFVILSAAKNLNLAMRQKPNDQASDVGRAAPARRLAVIARPAEGPDTSGWQSQTRDRYNQK